MHPRAFCNAYNIYELDISGNNLTRLPHLCSLVETIHYFTARFNKISSIRFRYFYDFLDLYGINLMGNRLGIGVEPDFSPLAQTLRSIRLSANPWGRLPVSLYNVTYPKLRAVFLDVSLISDIPVAALRSWPFINLLSIRHNLIHCLNDIRNTTRLTRIRIRANNNPWHCGSCMVSVRVVQVLHECL